MSRSIALLGLLVLACSPTPSPSVAQDQPSAGSVTEPPIAIACTPEIDTVPPALLGDACPGAISAVELAVAPVRLPIERIVILPGPFYCDVIWPGATTAPACFGTLVIPGQYMHAWVGFLHSEEVAAVMLGRDLPSDLSVPATTPLPWNATLVATQVPPAGWEMP